MSNHQILNPKDHLHLRVRTEADAVLGDGVMSCLTIPAEFRRLACNHPILFRRNQASGEFSAIALFGFEAGENLLLADGKWNASLRPLALAIQPFLVGRAHNGEGPAQVHIDMSHPRVTQSGEGNQVFEDDGKPTPYLKQMSDMLGALDEGYRASDSFFSALKRYDLLEPFSLDVSTNDGETNRLVGYHLINEEKLQALEPEVLADLYTGGHLAAMYMAVASLGNLTKLVNIKNKQANG